MIEIIKEFIPEAFLDVNQIYEKITYAAELLGVADQYISIKLCDDETIRKLNAQYRGFDKPTDVLSFNLDYVDPEIEEQYLGDIVLSIPQAQKQAPEYDLSLEDEIIYLLIHGILHLMGHDHADPAEKSTMFTKHEQIFNKVRER